MKLLVIVPMYNSVRFIDESIKSILSQGVDLRVIVVDDASTDLSKNKVSRMNGVDLISNTINMGTYYSINRALLVASDDSSWTHFTIHGSDDVSLSSRFKSQLSRFSGNTLAVGCGYNRVDYSTRKILNTNLKTDESALIFSREVFDSIGYYDVNRVGGDTEYKKRLLLKHPNSVVSIPKVLIKSYLHGENLTKKIPLGGSLRKKVVEAFTTRHKEMASTKNYYRNFNL